MEQDATALSPGVHKKYTENHALFAVVAKERQLHRRQTCALQAVPGSAGERLWQAVMEIASAAALRLLCSDKIYNNIVFPSLGFAVKKEFGGVAFGGWCQFCPGRMLLPASLTSQNRLWVSMV